MAMAFITNSSFVIASEAKQSRAGGTAPWIASSPWPVDDGRERPVASQ
jgi:hypothetical protein